MNSTKNIDDEGNISWKLPDGTTHRSNNLPAVEFIFGEKQYIVNGKLHRTNGPAIECVDGYKRWFVNDKEMTYGEFKRYLLFVHLEIS